MTAAVYSRYQITSPPQAVRQFFGAPLPLSIQGQTGFDVFKP